MLAARGEARAADAVAECQTGRSVEGRGREASRLAVPAPLSPDSACAGTMQMLLAESKRPAATGRRLQVAGVVMWRQPWPPQQATPSGALTRGCRAVARWPFSNWSELMKRGCSGVLVKHGVRGLELVGRWHGI